VKTGTGLSNRASAFGMLSFACAITLAAHQELSDIWHCRLERVSAFINLRPLTRRRDFASCASTITTTPRPLSTSSERSRSIFPSPFRKFRPVTVLHSDHSSLGIFPTSASLTGTYLQACPEVNGKVERSHETDSEEFYQGKHFKHKRDLARKAEEMGNRIQRKTAPSGASGETPGERLRELTQSSRGLQRISLD
jgi:hypothetical protein